MLKTKKRIVDNFETLTRHGMYGIARLETKKRIVKTKKRIVRTKKRIVKTKKRIVDVVSCCFYLIN
jgi:hypothetical protein